MMSVSNETAISIYFTDRTINNTNVRVPLNPILDNVNSDFKNKTMPSHHNEMNFKTRVWQFSKTDADTMSYQEISKTKKKKEYVFERFDKNPKPQHPNKTQSQKTQPKIIIPVYCTSFI